MDVIYMTYCAPSTTKEKYFKNALTDYSNSIFLYLADAVAPAPTDSSMS